MGGFGKLWGFWRRRGIVADRMTGVRREGEEDWEGEAVGDGLLNLEEYCSGWWGCDSLTV